MERFQRERVAKQRLTELMTRSATTTTTNLEEEEEQEQEHRHDMWQLVVELAILSSFNDQLAVQAELNMLERVMNMTQNDDVMELKDDDGDGNDPRDDRSGLDVTHIDANFNMKRETIRSQVFQPGYALPTMSLAEYADQELKDALERQERQNNEPDLPKRYEQLEQKGLEDDDALVEEAVYRDRSWDDWKDANPKGSGNKKWTQF